MSISSLTATGTPSSGRSLARPRPRVRLRRLQQRALGVDRGERVQLGIEALDPAQHQLNELPRRHLAAPDQLGLAGHPGERDLVVEHQADPKCPRRGNPMSPDYRGPDQWKCCQSNRIE